MPSERSQRNRLDRAFNVLTKWRSVFAGWQLGTRSDTDPECKAVKDHREVTILLRVEVTALTGLLLKKGIFTEEELVAQLIEEADYLNEAYARRFRGMRATDAGISYDLAVLQEHGTMDGWLP
jgi:hypothetical protein